MPVISIEPQKELLYYLKQSRRINSFQDLISIYHGAATSSHGGTVKVEGRFGQGKTGEYQTGD